ncbi:MAG: permease [Thiomonas sp. 13-66-29]|uniref:Uncharacterized membrane protein YhjC n=1 Tax=Thiomonas delicata TaxID=364030 RepID=A0A238D5D1_THIDL|nr:MULTISPECIES: DUF3311 domain-containing protein [Thiomonas]OZB45902.1 MAG: permease [Thiomonas sp. 15-66-11]OZB64133.1 MAG: permease [Thiomonas sp. 13-66-29]SBP88429.1 Uncharacterized membrane protein YhjC [Thiomonas delicata]
MKSIRYLAWIPPVGSLLGPLLHNDVHPFILGMPFILGWISVWLLLTTPVMALVYLLDPANREPADDEAAT